MLPTEYRFCREPLAGILRALLMETLFLLCTDWSLMKKVRGESRRRFYDSRKGWSGLWRSNALQQDVTIGYLY